MFNKKQREKLLDGLMGLAYSFAAISAGFNVFEHRPGAYLRAVLALAIMFGIAKLYKED